ncbi:hypothetical protein H920_12706 [Fukomys damarensis]|uniref:Uncharacterized protein n=1 Tax=Fukomys damarensis TaxID=885580 RepID=A0A091D4D9_FUKDA|nr:hypothetical protein H920_12706 [Fukomys damarensis]
MLLDQVNGRYKRKVIPPRKGHGSSDKKEKETNIGYETQGKSVLNYLYPSLNVPLLFLAVKKSKKKVIHFPPSSQDDCFFEKVSLGEEALEDSKVQHRDQGPSSTPEEQQRVLLTLLGQAIPRGVTCFIEEQKESPGSHAQSCETSKLASGEAGNTLTI